MSSVSLILVILITTSISTSRYSALALISPSPTTSRSNFHCSPHYLLPSCASSVTRTNDSQFNHGGRAFISPTNNKAPRKPSTELSIFSTKTKEAEKVDVDVDKTTTSKSQSTQQSSSNNDNNIYDEPLLLGLPQKSVTQPLSLLYLSQLVLWIGIGAVIPVLPIYGKAIGLSSATNGLIIAAPALALLLGARPAGEYADRARKPAMIFGMALIALSDFGTSIAQSLGPLLVARLGLGVGRCVSESGERGMFADLAGRVPESRGRILSVQQGVIAVGIALGAPTGGLIVETYGPRAAFLAVTGAALVSMVMYLFLPETVEKKGSSGNTEMITRANGTKEVEEKEETVGWGELLKDRRWWGISIFQLGANFGLAAKIASVPIIAASVLPGGAVGAGTLLSAAGLSGLVGGPTGGYLTDKLGSKNTVVLSGLLSATALLSVPFTLQIESPDFLPTGAAFAASILLWSTATAAQGPATTALAQELAPDGSESTAMALPRASGDACYLFAPFLLGLVADMSGVPVGVDVATAGFFGLLGVAALAAL